MTKCIVIGEQKKKTPIKFLNCAWGEKKDHVIESPKHSPSDWENIELVKESESDEYFDIMFAYDDDRSQGCIYFGWWNDGVVEE